MELVEKKNPYEIVELVFEAILSKKLNPGVKLSEIALQEEFGFSRNVVREGFSKLVDSGVLVHKKNQGVRVACPSKTQTKKIYQARKAIESGVILILVDKHIKNNLDMSQISDLIAKEEQLHVSDQFAKLTRISCHFHISLAELCGNEYLVESLKPLIPLSALAASVYARSDSHFCSYTEHQKLISALNSKNLEVAIRAMNTHLDHCVQSLDFESKTRQRTSYSYIFN